MIIKQNRFYLIILSIIFISYVVSVFIEYHNSYVFIERKIETSIKDAANAFTNYFSIGVMSVENILSNFSTNEIKEKLINLSENSASNNYYVYIKTDEDTILKGNIKHWQNISLYGEMALIDTVPYSIVYKYVNQDTTICIF